MPVNGLWCFLRNRDLLQSLSTSAEIRAMLENKRIAVDLGIWAVEGDTRESQISTTGTQIWKNFFIIVSFWRALRFLTLGSFPVGVMDGACPKLKTRQRHAHGRHYQHMQSLQQLFILLGCPVVQASSEAESLCAALSRTGMVDAVCSSDSDVFPFGAIGTLVKMIDIGGNDSSWHLEVADSYKIQSALGFTRSGMICLACLSGCDWITGWKGVGAETAAKMVRGLLQHTKEDHLLTTLLAFLEHMPTDLHKLADLNGCQTCRHCGHGPPKQRHGKKGCECCGTTHKGNGLGGCYLRSGPCPCPFHARHDEVILARTLRNCDQSITAATIKSAWNTYLESFPSTICNNAFTWRRPNVEEITKFLEQTCGYPVQNSLKNLLPVLLLWDVTHPKDTQSQFTPTAVVGECYAGFSDFEKQSLEVQPLVVMDWGVREGITIDDMTMQSLKSISRSRRSLPKHLAMKYCSELIIKFCLETINKNAQVISRQN